MISAGHYIDTGSKDFLRRFQRYPRPASGILGVGDHHVDAMLASKAWHQGFNSSPARLADYVTDKHQPHTGGVCPQIRQTQPQEIGLTRLVPGKNRNGSISDQL